MNLDELMNQIPPTVEYHLDIKYVGFHYSVNLKIVAGAKSTTFDSLSNDLSVALKSVSKKMNQYFDKYFIEICA